MHLGDGVYSFYPNRIGRVTLGAGQSEHPCSVW